MLDYTCNLSVLDFWKVFESGVMVPVRVVM